MPIKLTPARGMMSVTATDVPAFPGVGFGLGIPESIGDVARPVWFGKVAPEWRELEAGAWETSATAEGELSYRAVLTPTDDTVEIRMSLTNLSDRVWDNSLAFNCFGAGGAPDLADHECVRHWVGWNGEPRRLIEVPRQYSPRPAVALWSVEGAPPGEKIPFVGNFRATPPGVALEGWLAIVARDSKRLVATASKPTLFLFQNMEYSCIHASPSFGRLEPGQTGEAVNRIYFVESTLEDWHARMKGDLG